MKRQDKTRTIRKLVLNAVFSAALVLPAFRSAAQSLPITGGRGENYTVRQYYPAPRNTQLKFEITGTEAARETNGPANRIALKQLRISQFSEKGAREILIESPACVLDTATMEASSAGRLQIEYGNDQLRLGGEGFLWRNRSATLVISNDVRATVRLQTNNAPRSTSPLEITSRWFEFDVTNKHAIFHDSVHGSDGNQDFSCNSLAVRVSPNGRTMNVVEANGNVTFLVQSAGRKLTAQRCVYTRDDDRALLTGDVAWAQGRISGRADRVTVFQVSQKNSHNVDAQGNVAMKLPPDELQAAGGFLDSTNKPAKPTASNPLLVDVTTDRFVSVSNQIQLIGNVRLDDGTNTLTCAKIEALNAKAGTPGETAVATGNVTLLRGDSRVVAERAAYSRADGRIVFSGSPRWSAPNLTGSADKLVAATMTREVFAQDDVIVHYTFEPNSASLLDFFPNESASTNSAPVTIQIASRTFAASAIEREGVFSGGVRAQKIPADGAEPRMVSDSFTLKLAPTGNKPESFRARGKVRFEQGTPGVTNGPAIHRLMDADSVTARALATGALDSLVADGDVKIQLPEGVAKSARAAFNAASQSLELTGNPTLDTPQFEITEAEKLAWDRAKGSFRSDGRSRTTIKSLALPPDAGLPKLK